MSFEFGLLTAFAQLSAGTVAGVVLRWRAGAWRIALGVLTTVAIALALAIYVVTVGTIPHRAERVLPQPIAMLFLFAALGLFWSGPPLIGFVIGSAYVSRRETQGWLRLGISITGGIGVFIGAIWLLVVASQ